jgi:hypothetical protein
METIYLVFGERYKVEDIIYVGTNKEMVLNVYYACHDLDLDSNEEITMSIKYSDSWIQIWKNGKIVEKEWRPTLKEIN